MTKVGQASACHFPAGWAASRVFLAGVSWLSVRTGPPAAGGPRQRSAVDFSAARVLAYLRSLRACTVYNVLARLPGSGNTKAAMPRRPL